MQADAEKGRPGEWKSKVEVTLGWDFCKAGWWVSCERITLVACWIHRQGRKDDKIQEL